MNKPKKKDINSSLPILTEKSSKDLYEEYGRREGYNQACDDWDKYYGYLLRKIPSDKEINESPFPDYARAYCQGKFDILMDLKNKE